MAKRLRSFTNFDYQRFEYAVKRIWIWRESELFEKQ